MVTFQNTEQRHKKYIQQTIIDKFKVIFLWFKLWKLLNHFWIFVLASIATFSECTVRERFELFHFLFYGSDRIAADVRKLLSLPW
jgi:hypothetical protein